MWKNFHYIAVLKEAWVGIYLCQFLELGKSIVTFVFVCYFTSVVLVRSFITKLRTIGINRFSIA